MAVQIKRAFLSFHCFTWTVALFKLDNLPYDAKLTTREVFSGNVNVTIENPQLVWANPLEMAIFNSYVKLPEGIHDDFEPYLDE